MKMPFSHSFLLLISALCYCSASFSAPLNLKETLEYALSHSPVFAASKVSRTLADLDVSDKKSAFLPSLDIDSSVGLAKGKTAFPEEPWTSSLNLKLTENLYDNGRSITLLSKSNLSRDISELTLQKERASLCLEVTNLLYTYSSNQKLAIANNEQYALIQKQFTDAGNLYKGGLKSRRDFLRFKTDAQRAELEKQRAQLATEKIKLSLRKILGDSENKIEFAVIEPETLPTAAPNKPAEIQNTYEYRIAHLNSKSNELDTTLAKRKYWPNLNFAAGASYGNNSFIHSNNSFKETESYNANIGITLSFNLWDWGIRNREIERAESQVMISEYNVKASELEMSEQIKNLFLELENLKYSYALSQELLKAQEDTYKLIRRDYQEGQASYADMVDSLSKLLAAKTSYFQTRYQLAGAITKNMYYEGKIYEQILK